jgi:hypothetical protein
VRENMMCVSGVEWGPGVYNGESNITVRELGWGLYIFFFCGFQFVGASLYSFGLNIDHHIINAFFLLKRIKIEWMVE